jgi:DNA-binding response OmpR family regulator
LCVVDAGRDAYLAWQAAAANRGWEIVLAESASDALRLSRIQSIDRWVVCESLLEMPGSELCGMLRSRNRTAAICLVTDRHSPESERAAYAAGATMYAVKPLDAEWCEALTPALPEAAFTCNHLAS